MDEMLKDKRFAHVAKDPKFRRMPKNERKVKIDKRFQGMFSDKKFAVKYTIDKRGRPMNQTSSENLRKYYDMSSSEDTEVEDESEDKAATSSQATRNKKAVQKASGKNQKDAKTKMAKAKQESDDSESEAQLDGKLADDESDTESDNAAEGLDENEKQLIIKDKRETNIITKDVKQKLRDLTVDYARGEGELLSDSSSDDESSEQEDDEKSEIEHDWGELDKEAETTDEVTNRLAACNMDWDRIRAVDLLVLFNSFLPPGGLIRSVTIYPSDFGLQRMREEEVKGPIELVEANTNRKEPETDEENEEGSDYHMEKMRQYQLNRLKYFYAVIECDSPETANKIYTECDGIEYESTSTKLDLRFIPDDMTFDHEPKEICDKLPALDKYKPRQFTTTALQQVKVTLTWDETNPERQEITQKINSGKLNEIDETAIQTYLASGSSGDESENNQQQPDEPESDGETRKNPINKYKSLLKSIEDKEEAKKRQEVELEFTWGLGSKDKTEKLLKERMSKSESLTPFEQYIEKRKAKKKAKKEERKKSRDHNGDNSGASDSDDSVPSGVDMNDPYFADEMKNMKPKEKKIKKKKHAEKSSDDEEETQRKAELELLLLDKGDEEGKQHFNIKKIEEEATLSKSKRKRLSKKKKDDDKATIRDDFEVNVEDPRFAALYSSHHYNIDPADPHYRKTKGTEALVTEKLKRRADPNVEEQAIAKQPKRDGKMSADLAALVKSVKRNTKNILKPIK